MKKWIALAAAGIGACAEQPDYVEPGELAALAEVARSGQYADLKGTPDLAPFAKSDDLAAVATSGRYEDLDGTPDLAPFVTQSELQSMATAFAEVAWSGRYTDLADTPSLADVATTGSYLDLAHTPTLASVATSGSYADLPDAPWVADADIVSTLARVVVGDPSTSEALLQVTAPDRVTGPLSDQQSLRRDTSLPADTSVWQSFTAGATGQLTRIDLNLHYNAPDTGYTLRIHEGRGTSGATLHEETGLSIPIAPLLGGEFIELASAVPVQEGREYTFVLIHDTPFQVLSYPWSDYTRGTSSLQQPGYSNVILQFATYVTPDLPTALVVSQQGRVGIGVNVPSVDLDVAGGMRLRTPRSPTVGTACAQGEIAWDADHVYVCVAMNTWKRAALSTW